MAEGRKDDKGKLRWSLLPTGTVRAIIEVLEVGAKKYDVDNWKKVPDARTRYYDALLRHVEAWWNGEKLDPEDGLHHLAHAGCCLLFLLWLDQNPVPAPEGWVQWDSTATSMPVELLNLPPQTRIEVVTGGKDPHHATVYLRDLHWVKESVTAYRVVK